MIEITIGEADLATIKSALFADGGERCAVLFASQIARSDGSLRLLVRDFDIPNESDYLSRDAVHAALKPEFVARVTKRARRDNAALIFAHSHPGPLSPIFSAADDEGEWHLAKFLAQKHPDRQHCALVMSDRGYRVRQLGEGTEATLVSIGDYRRVLFTPNDGFHRAAEAFDRQVRAFGREGQRAIEQLTVGIAGLGGTGSLIAQGLKHLGVRRFVLIDPDTLETTNLNRVVDATRVDVGQAKVDIAKRAILAYEPDAQVLAIQGDMIRARIAKALFETDVIFGCTDSHGSRAVLQQVSFQYLIPCIDMGTTIIAKDQGVESIFGRVQLLSPNHACFACSGLLNSEEVRRDMMTAYERKLDPYIQGEREPAPAVISLNGTVASMAITMFMSFVTGLPIAARHVIYNAKTFAVRSVRSTPDPNCYICSRSGTYARGDGSPLFTRQD